MSASYHSVSAPCPTCSNRPRRSLHECIVSQFILFLVLFLHTGWGSASGGFRWAPDSCRGVHIYLGPEHSRLFGQGKGDL
jgi:hypothetical protein